MAVPREARHGDDKYYEAKFLDKHPDAQQSSRKRNNRGHMSWPLANGTAHSSTRLLRERDKPGMAAQVGGNVMASNVPKTHQGKPHILVPRMTKKRSKSCKKRPKNHANSGPKSGPENGVKCRCH